VAARDICNLNTGRHTVVTALASLCLLAAALPAAAYTPQVFDTSKDTGQDFTAVPANTAWNASNGINRKVWNNIWGSQLSFSGPSKGLLVSSSAAAKWPNTGMMQATTSCSAGFGYGDFHWRAAIASANQGPGENMIMWPADGDGAWPGIIKNSDDNHISEVDVSETNYARNGTSFATFHYYNANTAGHNGQIMHLPITFPVGNMTSMHDYDEIWGPGSLVLKVDGVVQMTAPPTQVRADYAHGGCNYTLGAQMAMQATGYDVTPAVGLYLANMWWSATDGSAGSGTSVPIAQPAPTPTPTPAPTPVTTTSPVLTVAASSYTTPAKLHVTVAKAEGKSGTLQLSVDGTYLGTIADNAPDGTLALGYSFGTAPAAGMHSFKISINGDTNPADAANGTFTVP